jgi:large repetitive protein
VKFPAVMFRILSLILFLATVLPVGRAQVGDFKVYVTLPGSNTVAIVDGLTNAVVATIPAPGGTGTSPFSVALTPDARFAYVVNGQGCNNGASYSYPGAGGSTTQGFVWVLDTASKSSVATIPVGLCPQEMTFSPNGARAYVTNTGLNAAGPGTLSVIDTTTNSVVQTVALPDIPIGLAVTPDGSNIYIATNLSVTVVSAATNTVVANIPTASPTGFLAEVAITPNGQQVYVTDNGDSTVYVISTQTNSVVFSFPANTFPTPWGLAISADGSKVYVPSYSVQFTFSGNIVFGGTFVIDTATQTFVSHPLCQFDVHAPSACAFSGNFGQSGSSPIFVQVTPDGAKAYFSADSANLTTPITGELMVFDTVKNIPMASPLFSTVPAGLAVAPADNTPVGTNILVQPVDAITKTLPVSVTFSNVAQPGFTSLITGATGPAAPSAFQLGNPPVYYNLATTATTSSGSIVCINYSGVTFGSSALTLNQFENSAWVDVTASVDTVNRIICGSVSTLGTFAIFAGGSTGAPTATTTTLASSTTSSAFGQSVALTATVSAASSSAGTPTGIVNFADETTALGSVALINGQAVLTLSSLAVGTHSIAATYLGTANFGGSASSPLAETVNPAPTSIVLSSSANPSTYAESITLTATISGGTGITGTVAFMNGAKLLGQRIVVGGVASINTGVLGNAGTPAPLTAAYSGDSNFNPSTSAALAETINPEPTTCRLEILDASNRLLTIPNPFDGANIDVQVLPQNPSGLITSTLGASTTISDNGAVLSQLFNSTVEFAVGQDVFTPGSHKYVGSYSGDSNNLPSQCTAALTIDKVQTSLTLTSSLNPAPQGQAAVFEAKVTAAAPAVPSGNVIFSDGGTQLTSVPFDPTGTAMYSTSSLTAGVHAIAANYLGDQNFLGSSAKLTQTVTSSGGGSGGGGGTCACTKTGIYVAPVGAVLPSVGTQASSTTFLSPNAKYLLTITIDNANQNTTMGITLAGTSTQVLPIQTLPITAAGGWGFSPDSDRFVIAFEDNVGLSSESQEIYVYDLTVKPARAVVHTGLSTNIGPSLAFSPSGRYFVYSQGIGQSQAETQIYRVQGVTTQDLVFDSGFYSFAVGSGTDFQTGSSGFSPDNPETSFIYSYVTGQTTFQWNLVNLASGHRVANTYNSGSAAWSYSPCADVVGVAWQLTPTLTQVDLYDTKTGKTLQGSGAPIPALAVGLETTSSGQEVTYVSSGQSQTTLLSPPPCNQPNTPAGNNVSVAPQDTSTATSPMTVTFGTVTQAGQTNVTVSNTGSAPPPNFQLGNPPTYYDLTTTATFTGGAVVCINYGGITFNNQSAIKLFHSENGVWVDRTTSTNTTTHTVCGTVSSFSPFILAEPQGPPAANVAAVGGTPQIASIFTAFPAPLRAIVTDSNGNPMSGVTVNFLAPAVGATGTFSGSGVLAIVTTDSTGVATAPLFTADGIVGSYAISASVNGLSAAANFLLTNSKAGTTATLANLTSSATYGSPVTFIASVATPIGAPTGSIAFSDAGNPLGGTPLNGLTATLTVPSLSAGAHSITATYSGDNTFNGSTSAVFSLTVSPAPLVIAANNATRPYGSNNPIFTGAVSGLLNGDSITATFASSASPASPVGTYAILPTAVGGTGVLGNYTIQLVNGVFTVAPEATSLKATIAPASIPVGQSTVATITITAPDMVIPIDPSVLAPITVTSPIVSDILSNGGVCATVPSTAPGIASCTITVTSVEPNGRTLTANFAGSPNLASSSATADLIVTAALKSQNACIKSDFRNVAVAGGNSIWFNSIFKVRDLDGPTQKVNISFFNSSFQFQYKDANGNLISVNQSMPDAHIVIDPSVSVASTSFDSVNNVWITTIPWDLDDNAFLTGMSWAVPPGGLPADVEPVTVCGTFASDVADIDIGWRWAAAAYSSFDTGNSTLGVKPMDSDHDNPASNHDRAGTPENYKQFVIPGARGKGGRNYTGSYSGGAQIE